jgi:hypothetical protein
MAFVGAGLRLTARRPLWPRHSRSVSPVELAGIAVAVTTLAFHCAAMFFADWVDAVPFAETPARAVRSLGVVSQVAYWVPAAGLVIALRRLWPPAVGLLVLTLIGVGVTMFVPHALTTHLAWLASAVITVVLIATALIAPRGPRDEGSI